MIARWTIGNVSRDGQDCLVRSVESFLRFHHGDVVIYHNCPIASIRKELYQYDLRDQSEFMRETRKPVGVAWKLYPPRVDISQHEISIDNDIVFQEPISEIESFLQNDVTLMLEGDSRTYGRFEKHVPPKLQINSGIYGMPPGFDLKKYVDFFGGSTWDQNALGEHAGNVTFDEQGIVALALSKHPHIIISNHDVTNCHRCLVMSKAMHFITLNRVAVHGPYRNYLRRLIPFI